MLYIIYWGLIIIIRNNLIINNKNLNKILENKPISFKLIHYDKTIVGKVVISKLLAFKHTNNCDILQPPNLEINDISIGFITYLGDCSPIAIAKNAIKYGAKILLIINKNNKISLPYNINIKIPILSIDYKQGVKMYNFIENWKNKKNLIISFSKKIKKSDVVDFGILIDVNGIKNYDFLLKLIPYLQSFNENINIKILFNNKNCYSNGQNCNKKLIQNRCLFNNKLLCRLNGNKDELKIEIILDCSIYLNILKEILNIWLTYCKNKLSSRCIIDNLNFNYHLLTKLDTCIRNKNNISYNISNNNKKYNEINYNYDLPLIIINNIPYHGFLSENDIFNDLCKTFLKSPKNCLFKIDKYIYNKSFNDLSNKKNKENNNKFLIILIFVIILLFFVGVFLYYIFTKSYNKILNNNVKEVVKNSVINFRKMKNNE